MVPTAQPPPSDTRETLDLGPHRSPLAARLPPAVRQRLGLVVAGAIGVACGAAAMAWWSDDQQDDRSASPGSSTSPPADVRLVLSAVRRTSLPSDIRDRAMVVDAALVHGRGPGTVTVTRISRPGGALSIRTRALPLTLSVNRSYVPVRLRIAPRDCALATQWTPSSQPFALTWEDDGGNVRTQLGGDHDAVLEIAMTGFLDTACADR